MNLTTVQRSKARDPRTEQLNQMIIEGIRDKKGKKVVLLDLRNLEEAPTDFFIICEGGSSTQIKAIAGSIQKKVKEELHTMPSHTEGTQNARWILMDYFNTIVHVFYPETREFYDIENLWSDAKTTEYAEV